MAVAGVLEILITTRDETSSGLSKAEKRAKSTSDKLSSWAIAKGKVIGRAMEKAASASYQFLKGSVSESMSFDKSMAQVAATLGKSTKEVQNLSKFARKMGAETAFTAQEAAQGLNYMALAGYSAEKSMKMLPKVLDLAAAGNFDLARASDMVTDAESALGLTTKQVGVLIDQMAKAASKTNTSVEQLGEGILTIGGTARQLRGGTRELTVLLGALADNGIKGSEGGTMLRNVLQRLTNPTSKAAKELKKIGVNAFDSKGKLRTLSDVFVDFNKATSKMTMQERAETLGKIFNVRDLKAIEALLGTSTKKWKELNKEIKNSKGAAKEMAETQLDNLAGDVTKFKSAFSEAKLSLVDGITPTLRRIVKTGTALVGRLTKAFKEKGLKGAIEEAGTVFNDFIDNLKGSDDTGMQTLGTVLGGVRDIASELLGLITDFPGKLQEWKESDSPGLNLLSSLLGSASDAIGVIIEGFNNGIPAAVKKLEEIDTPLSNLAADALNTLQSVCEWFNTNGIGVADIISGVAIAFAGFKTLKISASVLTFISKLSSIKNAGQLNKLLQGLQNGDLTGTGTPKATTPTVVPAGTKATIWDKISQWTNGFNLNNASVVWDWFTHDSIFGTLFQGTETPQQWLDRQKNEIGENKATFGENWDIHGENANVIAKTIGSIVDGINSFFGGTPNGETLPSKLKNNWATVFTGMFSDADTEKQVASEWNDFVRDVFNDTKIDPSMYNSFMDIFDYNNLKKSLGLNLKDFSAFLEDSFTEAFDLFNQGDIEGAKKVFDIPVEPDLTAVNELEIEDKEAKAEYTADMTAVDAATAPNKSAVVNYKAVFGTPEDNPLDQRGYPHSYDKSKLAGYAKGNWYVPYDNYPALLHRGEMVLNKSQARMMRDGASESTDIGGAIDNAVAKAMSRVYVMLNGDKVGDLTTRRINKNINASSYNKLRALGG